ncbi:uncharacterized protein LOC101737936 isoform X2 [Bombyx mori]|nr:uncharacterized protein LOC101737936 isoform X2 [Bombyx mori]XP_037873554.1 uncharacterized protein LOC101737936 isoform X2 [Bombyx mori]
MKLLIVLALIGAAAAASIKPVQIADIPIPKYESIDAGMYIIPDEVIQELALAGIELSENVDNVAIFDIEIPVDNVDFPVDSVNFVENVEAPVENADFPADSVSFVENLDAPVEDADVLADSVNFVDNVDAPVEDADVPADSVSFVDNVDAPVEDADLQVAPVNIVDEPVEKTNEEIENDSEVGSISWVEYPAELDEDGNGLVIVDLPIEAQPEDLEKAQLVDLPVENVAEPEDLSPVQVVNPIVENSQSEYPGKRYPDATWR